MDLAPFRVNLCVSFASDLREELVVQRQLATTSVSGPFGLTLQVRVHVFGSETSGLTSNVPPTCSASLIPCAQTYLVPLDDLYLGGPHAQQWFTALPKLDLMFLHEWDDHNYNYTEQQFAIVGNHRVKKGGCALFRFYIEEAVLLPTGNEMAAYYPSLSRHILSKLKSEEKKLQSYREVLPSRKPQKVCQRRRSRTVLHARTRE
ncbi:hypothetical protein RB195_009722 [Necator americanus]|uniref:Uncharacterized protein n=1 Tax=Necator americanus TaxID=51031 RepID=A0ABR1CV62_NECAM